jgi:hypothetical protein
MLDKLRMAEHMNNIIIPGMANLLNVPNRNNPDIDSKLSDTGDVNLYESMNRLLASSIRRRKRG